MFVCDVTRAVMAESADQNVALASVSGRTSIIRPVLRFLLRFQTVKTVKIPAPALGSALHRPVCSRRDHYMIRSLLAHVCTTLHRLFED